MIFWNYLRGRARPKNIPERMLQHAGNTDTCGTFVPATGGPTAIMIGAKASDDAVKKLAASQGLRFEDLIRFKQQIIYV